MYRLLVAILVQTVPTCTLSFEGALLSVISLLMTMKMTFFHVEVCLVRMKTAITGKGGAFTLMPS